MTCGPTAPREMAGPGDGTQADPAAQLLGQRWQQLPVPAHHLGGVGEVVEDRAADDRAVLADVVAGEREGGDDAEVPAPAAQRPEQVAVGVLAGGHERPVREDHVGGHQIIDGQPEAPGQIADPAAEGQPGHAGRRDQAGGGGHAERHGRVVNVPPGASRIGADRVGAGADRGAAQQRHVDDQRAVPHPRPAALWPPPRTAIWTPCARANRTQVITSAVSRHRTTAAGRLSIIAL